MFGPVPPFVSFARHAIQLQTTLLYIMTDVNNIGYQRGVLCGMKRVLCGMKRVLCGMKRVLCGMKRVLSGMKRFFVE